MAKAKFDLMASLTANRDYVIAKFNELKNETLYNGLTLREFMLQIVHIMRVNNPRSEKRFNDIFKSLVGRVYNDNLHIEGSDYMVEKYRGTAFSALV